MIGLAELVAIHQKGFWWRQTGSNRRPHACKARALPAELCPRSRKHEACLSRVNDRLSLAGLPSRAEARAAQSAYAQDGLRRDILALACASEGWWAWEDLNFRPHAYQARALTN